MGIVAMSSNIPVPAFQADSKERRIDNIEDRPKEYKTIALNFSFH